MVNFETEEIPSSGRREILTNLTAAERDPQSLHSAHLSGKMTVYETMFAPLTIGCIRIKKMNLSAEAFSLQQVSKSQL